MRRIAAVAACLLVLGGADGVRGQNLTPTPPPPLTRTAPPPLTPAPPPPLTPAAPPPLTSNPPSVTPSSITPLSTFTVGNWNAGAYSASGSTTFDNCNAYASYVSGITMGFAVSRTFQWSMAFEDQAWSLTPQQSYPIAFTVDGGAVSSAIAIAVTANTVTVPLADSVPLFEKFMHGEVLRVDAASQVFTFKLTNTVELLPALLKCVQINVGVQGSSANPFAAQ